jgi:hypothetical protein
VACTAPWVQSACCGSPVLHRCRGSPSQLCRHLPFGHTSATFGAVAAADRWSFAKKMLNFFLKNIELFSENDEQHFTRNVVENIMKNVGSNSSFD